MAHRLYTAKIFNNVLDKKSRPIRLIYFPPRGRPRSIYTIRELGNSRWCANTASQQHWGNEKRLVTGRVLKSPVDKRSACSDYHVRLHSFRPAIAMSGALLAKPIGNVSQTYYRLLLIRIEQRRREHKTSVSILTILVCYENSQAGLLAELDR